MTEGSTATADTAGSVARGTDGGRRTQAERSEATRAKLLQATLECLAELGYARTSTTEVCQRAGVSRGAQLHHFPTKAELVAAAATYVLDRRLEEVTATVGAIPPGPERVQAVIELLWGIFQSPAAHAWHELVVAARTDDELRPHVAAIAQRLDEEVRAAWTELFPEGLHGLEPAINAAVPALLFAVLSGLATHRMSGAPNADRDAEQVLNLVKALGAYFDVVNPLEA